MPSIESPVPLFADVDGTPLESGYVYFGVVNQNPETTPISVFWDASLTQPAPQPLRTSGGVLVRNGTPAVVYTSSTYSITVRDRRNRLVYTFPDSTITSNGAGLALSLADSTDAAKGDALVAFKQPVTGAVASTVHNKLLESFSVKDFGAKGDGITDDTAAINAALAVSSGRILFFPAGTYLISSTLTVKSKTTLLGEGTSSSTLKLTAGMSASAEMVRNEVQTGTLNAYYDTDLVFDGLGFDGSNNATRTGPLLSFGKVLRILIQNCLFKDNTYFAIGIGANKDVLIRQNYFTNMGRPRPSTVSAPAIWCDKGAWGTPYEIRVEDNYFLNNNWSAAYFMPTNGSFSRNYCVGNGESTVFSNSNGANIQYVGNYIYGATRSNISACGIETGASGITISGNIISACGDTGIVMTDVDTAVVSDNIISNNGQEVAYYPSSAGIGVLTLTADPNMPKNIRIHGNRIADRQAIKTQWAGISVGGTGGAVSNVVIHDNDLKDQKTNSIYKQAGKWGAGSYERDNINKGGTSQAIKIVQFQVAAATGNQVITGVGFRPRAVEIIATVVSATQSYQSIGIHDGVSSLCNMTSVDAAGRSAGIQAALIAVRDSAGNPVATATLSSFDEDGFTINNSAVATRPWCIAKCYF